MCCLTMLLTDKRRFLLSYSTVILVSTKLWKTSLKCLFIPKIFGFLISLSPTMAATAFIKDPLVEKNLRYIAYVSGILSSTIGIMGFIVAFTRSKTCVTLAIITTSVCLVSLVSLAAHAFTYLSYHVSVMPTKRILLIMNRTWIGLEGENFQKAVKYT